MGAGNRWEKLGGPKQMAGWWFGTMHFLFFYSVGNES
jgi:hypothetical protein